MGVLHIGHGGMLEMLGKYRLVLLDHEKIKNIGHVFHKFNSLQMRAFLSLIQMHTQCVGELFRC